ncbi:MAG: hypothetical protein ACRD0K_28915 [Egibacteraceae bacterium]
MLGGRRFSATAVTDAGVLAAGQDMVMSGQDPPGPQCWVAPLRDPGGVGVAVARSIGSTNLLGLALAEGFGVERIGSGRRLLSLADATRAAARATIRPWPPTGGVGEVRQSGSAAAHGGAPALTLTRAPVDRRGGGGTLLRRVEQGAAAAFRRRGPPAPQRPPRVAFSRTRGSLPGGGPTTAGALGSDLGAHPRVALLVCGGCGQEAMLPCRVGSLIAPPQG